MQNILNIEPPLWEKAAPLCDELIVVTLKIAQLNGQKKYDMADAYAKVKNQLECDIEKLFEP